MAGAVRLAAGVLKPAGIGWPGCHPVCGSRSCPGRAGIWRAHGAAGACRRLARRTARAVTAATATLSQRGDDWRNKQRDATMDLIKDVLVIPNLPLRFNDNAILVVPRRNNLP